jgi:hypothetical protein
VVIQPSPSRKNGAKMTDTGAVRPIRKTAATDGPVIGLAATMKASAAITAIE